MGNSFGPWARTVLLVGMIALGGMSTLAVQGTSPTARSIAFAGPAYKDNNENHNNDLGSDDNNDERQLRGQVLELHDELSPPEALVATTGENVWARLYNDQLHRSGVRAGDHVKMRGEYNKGVFDADEVDVQDRCCPGPNNHNGNGNDNR